MKYKISRGGGKNREKNYRQEFNNWQRVEKGLLNAKKKIK